MNKKQEKLLNESRFRHVLREAEIGIALFDLHGNLLEHNRALQWIFGYPRERFHLKDFDDLVHPDDLGKKEEAFKYLLNENKLYYQSELRGIRVDRSIIWLRLTLTLHHEESHSRYIIGLIENITQLRQDEAEIAEVEHRLIDHREEETVQLARDLHEGAVQDLLAISYQLSEMEESLQDERQVAQMGTVRASLHRTIRNLQLISRELSPATLAPFGLKKTIHSYIDQIKEKLPELKVETSLAEDDGLLPVRVRLVLFRICQKVLMNVFTCSQAKKVAIRFGFNKNRIWLEIEDDGRGFEVPKYWIEFIRQGKFGLLEAAERAEAVGGRLNIHSNIGKGTTTRVLIPRNEENQYPPLERLSTIVWNERSEFKDHE